jgi:glutamate/tyrosine decarboxylase-like PLP-dependent enzyme
MQEAKLPRAGIDAYATLMQLLDERGARYRLIDHPPEGRTELVSPMRGHEPRLAAKCMVLMVKVGKKTTRYALAVVPGHKRVDLAAVKALFGATYVSFASTEVAERLAGCVTGTVLPFVLEGELELVVDPALRDADVMYFNAGRLDRSVELSTVDYFAIASPRVTRIAAKDLLGLPAAWSVGFVTGAQLASFTALLAARHHVLSGVGWDVERDGLFGAPPIHVVVSDESHRTIVTALRMLGLGAERLSRVEADAQGRMRPDRLEAALRSAPGPCIVCAQAGNVNTGAFDPIATIASLARERGAWVHVDGAFGLWAAASASLRHLVTGIESADSVASDGHKWLNVPYDSGFVFTAHPDSHQRALTVSAHYIQMTPGERDPRAFAPDESRRARGVAVYAALRALGRNGVRDLVDRCCACARRMADALRQHSQVRILNDIVLNQVLLQFVPQDGDGRDAGSFTEAVVAATQAEGTCWFGSTQWHGQRAARISICNWSTTERDIDRSAAAILRVVGETNLAVRETDRPTGRPS